MAKPKQRLEARNLRSRGVSIKAIAKELGVSVGSVSGWCSDVVLSQTQLEKLAKDAKDPNYGKRLENSQKQHKLSVAKGEQLLKVGIKAVGKLSKRELFLVGVALYWAEGFKKDSQAGLGSSDPEMILLFVRWLKDGFGYTNSDLLLRVTVNEAHEYRIGEITEHWSELLGIPIADFKKPFYQHVKWKKEYDRPEEYFGVLRVRVRRSKDFLRKIYGYIAGLKQGV